MKRSILILVALLSSAFCYADEINMVGDPPNSHEGRGNRDQASLPSLDYTDGEVTIFVPYQIDDMAVTIRDDQGDVLKRCEDPFPSFLFPVH